MRVKFLLISFFLLFTIKSYSQCDILVWSDEFDGTGLPNSAYWGFDTGAGGWGNNEVQNYTNTTSNVHQEDGKLIIEAKKFGTAWTSARVKSQNKMTFTYGKLVFRAKLPVGGGTWPALWMLGQNISSVPWPDCGEIDVMEHVGNNTTRVQSALHTRSSFGNTQNVAATTVPTAETAFHDYAVSWNADRIAFSVDGVVFYTYAPANKTVQNYPFTADQFIIMNIAMGGNLGGTINPSLTYAKMEIEYVRLYEERAAPAITGPKFVYENQNNLQFEAPEYDEGVGYTWTVPDGVDIISGQGTNQLTVDWNDADGTLGLELTGDTGCTINSTELNVSTIVEPTGDKYLAHSFATSQLTGWTTNSSTNVNLESSSGKLNVTYNLGSLKYIQFELPKAVDIQHYSIVKLPITIPAASASIPELIMTFRDGNENETIATSYELNASVKDGVTRLYSFDFDGLWDNNTPEVNPNLMKYVRIYMSQGQGSFSVGDLYFYNNETIPATPTTLSAETNGTNEVKLSWQDVSNATVFHIYRSATETGTYTRVESNVETSENPYVIVPTTSINYYKVSGENENGESALSNAAEAVAVVTATEDPLKSVSLSPNPSNGKFQIMLPEHKIDRIDIYDLQGREVRYKTDAYNNESLTVTITNPIHGIYFLRLIQKNKSRIYKILVD